MADLKIRFLLWVARIKITRINYTIVHQGTEKFTERSLLKRDWPPELGRNIFFYSQAFLKNRNLLNCGRFKVKDSSFLFIILETYSTYNTTHNTYSTSYNTIQYNTVLTNMLHDTYTTLTFFKFKLIQQISNLPI